LAVVLLLGSAGCSAAVGSYGPTPAATPSVLVTPATGRSLASAGFTNPIAQQLWLPIGTTLTLTADQPNLVTVVGELDQADGVQAYLAQTLPGLGWTITAQGDGGLVFEQGVWQGGYARGSDNWALTVRND